jgi:tRNA 2-thiocytidine biosynthesis protein TtcA
MFTAIQNVTPSHLADHKLHDFKNISTGDASIAGDQAFDQPEIKLPIPATEIEIIELS